MDKKKLLVFGADGMVASRFIELTSKKYIFDTPNYKKLDITNSKLLEEYVKRSNPDVVINFAAFTDVGKAEDERGDKTGQVYKVNFEAVKDIVKLCRGLNLFIVHISTDMVFSGSENNKGPYVEKPSEARLKDLTWYGYTKLLAEKEVLKYSNAAIVRIIYPVRSKFQPKLDYIRKILNLSDNNKLYPFFTDQQLNITNIDELSDALDIIVENKSAGIFHVASSNLANPYELAKYLLDKTDRDSSKLKPNLIADFYKKTGAKKYRYPQYGGLKTAKSQKKLKIKYLTWQEIINKLFKLS